MDPAVNQAVNNVNQAANTTMWLTFAFVIAPFILAIIAIPIAIIEQRKLKCPRCGNYKRNRKSGVQTVRTVEGNKATTTRQRLVTCKKCKNEFTV